MEQLAALSLEDVPDLIALVVACTAYSSAANDPSEFRDVDQRRLVLSIRMDEPRL